MSENVVVTPESAEDRTEIFPDVLLIFWAETEIIISWVLIILKT